MRVSKKVQICGMIETTKSFQTVERLIYSLAIFLAVWAGYSVVDELSIFLAASDEINSYNAVVHAAEGGVPLKGPHPDWLVYDANSEYPVYGSHLVISYMNVPIYYFAQATGISMELLYGCWPYFLILGIVFVAIWVRPNARWPKELTLLFLPTILSSWTLASLHFIRYYSYSYVFMIVCAYFAYRVYTSELRYALRLLLTLVLLFIPGLFHQVNFTLLVFGFGIIVFDFFRSGRHKLYEKRTLITGAVGFLVLFGLAFFNGLFRATVRQFLAEVDFSLTFQAMGNYFKVNQPSGFFFVMGPLVLFFAATVLSLKKKKFVNHFFLLSLGYFFFSWVILSVVMGGEFNPPYGFNRYYLIVHIAYIVALGTGVYILLEALIEKLKWKNVPPVYPFVALVGALYLTVGNVLSPFNVRDQNFSLIPRFERPILDVVEKEMEKHSETVFLTSRPAMMMHYFNEVPCYAWSTSLTLEELKVIAETHPNGTIWVLFGYQNVVRPEIMELVLTILPEYQSEMLIKSSELTKVLDYYTPVLKEKYGV